MKRIILSITQANLLFVCVCMFSFIIMNSCKDDNDNEDEILEQRDGYRKFIDHKLKGTKGTLKEVKGWLFKSPEYGWTVTFGDIYSENYDRTQLPIIEAGDLYYILSDAPEEYQKYKDRYVIINGKYTYLYTTDCFDIDYWVSTVFFNLKCTSITPLKE